MVQCEKKASEKDTIFSGVFLLCNPDKIKHNLSQKKRKRKHFRRMLFFFWYTSLVIGVPRYFL